MQRHRRIFDDFWEPEITNLEHVIVHQDVGGFKVTVDSFLTCELLITLDDLFHHLVGLGLLEFLFQFEVLFEVTIATVLHDDV